MSERTKEELAIEEERDTTDAEESVDEAMLERLLAQPFSPFDELRREADAELGRREGEWSAFTASVFRQIDEQATATERLSIEDQAIVAFKTQVEGELAEMAPRFEGAFKQGIEDRIWREAQARPTIGEAISSWLEHARQWLVGQPRAIGLAAAGAAAVLAIALNVPTVEPELTLGSAVKVDRVAFEGNVTVMQEGGVTVVWLADNSG